MKTKEINFQEQNEVSNKCTTNLYLGTSTYITVVEIYAPIVYVELLLYYDNYYNIEFIFRENIE